MVTELRPNFEAHVAAVEHVKQQLRTVTKALDEHEIPYAVVGGNAVAAWVATMDRGATRTTKDVDLLVRRDDLLRMESVLSRHGFDLAEVYGVTMFIPRDKPNPRTAVHLVFANEFVKAHETYASPDVSKAIADIADYRVIELLELLKIKLLAYRRLDQVHVEDMLKVGLIDAELAGQLPEDLLGRLREIRDTMEWHEAPPEF